MSIEKDLGRIATALEGILKGLNSVAAPSQNQAATQTKAPAPKASAPAPQAEGATAPAPQANTPADATLHQAVTESVPMTMLELDEALKVEAGRLGNTSSIRTTLTGFGVKSLNELKAVQYLPLLNTIKALQA